MPLNKLENSESVGRRIFLILPPALLIIANVFIIGPVTVYRGNNAEFGMDLIDLIPFYSYPIILLILVTLILGIFLSGKRLQIYVSVLFTVGLLLWIQGNFLVWKYGVLDGQGIKWSSYSWEGLLDTAVWIILLIAALIFCRRISRVSSIVSLVLVCLQLTGLLIIYLYTPKTFFSSFPAKENVSENLYHYSSSFNIIHFVFDGFQTEVFEEIVNEENLHSYFDGFVLFRENLTVSGSTLLSLGAIFSGEMYDGKFEKGPFYVEALTEKGFQNILYDNGYDVNLIPGIKLPGGKFSNHYRVPSSYGGTDKEKAIDEAALLMDLTLFRHFPHYLKRSVYNDQNWRIRPLVGRKKKIGYWHHLDFLKDYVEGIRVGTPKPAYHYMHVIMPHPPFVTTENGECSTHVLPPTRDNYKTQAKYTLETFIPLLEKLKKLGVYDSSLIIIQADHGIEFPVKMNDTSNHDKDYLNKETHSTIGRSLALLAMKRPHSKGPMKSSDAKTSTIDVAPTIMKIADLTHNYGGYSVFEIDPTEQRERLYGNHLRVVGSAYSFDSWKKSTNVAKSERPAVKTYKWGAPIVFTFLGNAESYQVAGWADPEEELTWTVKQKATLRIPIKQSTSALVMTLKFKPFLYPGSIDQQRVSVFIDDQTVSEWIIRETGFQERTLIIPHRVLGKSDSLLISFNIPNAISPLEIGKSSDPRLLGIGINTLMLDELEFFEPGRKMTIKFGLSGNSQLYETDGWSAPEEGLTWTFGKRASLTIPIDVPKSAVSLNATYSPFIVPGKLDTQTVEILINGRKAGNWIITKPGVQKEILFIQKDFFEKSGIAQITFNIPYATSPAMLGVSNDQRILGLAMREIILTE